MRLHVCVCDFVTNRTHVSRSQQSEPAPLCGRCDKCDNGTEWQTDWSEYSGQWAGCFDSGGCCRMRACACMRVSIIRAHTKLPAFAVRNSGHRCASLMPVSILASVKDSLCSLLFPHWQPARWHGLLSLHPYKERGRLYGSPGGDINWCRGVIPRKKRIRRWGTMRKTNRQKNDEDEEGRGWLTAVR